MGSRVSLPIRGAYRLRAGILALMVFALVAGAHARTAHAAVPVGYACTGNCDTLGADGVVTLSPFGSAKYTYISTTDGQGGVGGLPTGPLGSETNGSLLVSPVFSANAGDLLKFYFNYVTSDGSGFADYAWAAVADPALTPASVEYLVTARTQPEGSIIPGFGMPGVASTLTPASVPIIGGAPVWSPLGGFSGSCYAEGCGYTGWVSAEYSIPAAGNYVLAFGTVNWSDQSYDSGLAIDGATIAGEPIGGGKISARGTVQTEEGPTIGFSAANDCNPTLSTRPSFVGTTAGAVIWKKSSVTDSTCSDQPPDSPLGFDTQSGTATGTFGAGGSGRAERPAGHPGVDLLRQQPRHGAVHAARQLQRRRL